MPDNIVYNLLANAKNIQRFSRAEGYVLQDILVGSEFNFRFELNNMYDIGLKLIGELADRNGFFV